MPESGLPYFYILIVAKNAGEKLIDTVGNILAQSYPRMKVLVRDGASTDDSPERLKELYASDGRLVCVSEEDHGIYDAMNRAAEDAIALAKKADHLQDAWCLFLNCGDKLYDEQVLKQAAARIRHVRKKRAMRMQIAPGEYDVTLCYGDTYERKTGQIVTANPVIDDFACYRNLPCHQSTLYALRIFEKEQYNTKWNVRADYEHFLRLKYLRHVSPVYLRMTIADYEGGGFSETEENVKRSEEERAQIISMYLPKSKVLKYDLYRTATLQPLRKALAENEKTAAFYQKIKRAVYKGRDKEETDTTS